MGVVLCVGCIQLLSWSYCVCVCMCVSFKPIAVIWVEIIQVVMWQF